MSLLSAIGNRPIQPSLLPAATLAGSKAAGAQTASVSGNTAARLPVVEPVPAPSDGVSLSSQALAARVGQLGSATVDLAQQFINSFAAKLFGDQANGATLSFDSATLSADASFSAAVGHTFNQGGSVDTATLSLNESAHFIGTGRIVTADGRAFQFTIEVNYQASAHASSVQASQPAPQIAGPDVVALTGKSLPEIAYPGSLDDLFKLLGRELRARAPNDPSGGNSGNLSLRLLDLVNRAALLAPHAQPDDPKATMADRNKALANSYAAPTPATSTEIASA